MSGFALPRPPKNHTSSHYSSPRDLMPFKRRAQEYGTQAGAGRLAGTTLAFHDRSRWRKPNIGSIRTAAAVKTVVTMGRDVFILVVRRRSLHRYRCVATLQLQRMRIAKMVGKCAAVVTSRIGNLDLHRSSLPSYRDCEQERMHLRRIGSECSTHTIISLGEEIFSR